MKGLTPSGGLAGGAWKGANIHAGGMETQHGGEAPEGCWLKAGTGYVQEMVVPLVAGGHRAKQALFTVRCGINNTSRLGSLK